MPTLAHLINHKRIASKKNPVYIFGLFMLFWSIFDGILAYIAPLIITEHGLSKTHMGLLIGSSSMFGALFDILAVKIFPDIRYRRVLMIMFVLCLIYPFVLFNAKTIALYITAMAIWGMYYDLKNFGMYNFVGQYTEPTEHVSSFGAIQAMQSVGYVIAPIIAGIIVMETITWLPFLYALLFLLFAFLCFAILLSKNISIAREDWRSKRRVTASLHTLITVNKTVFPVLLLTFILYIIDAFFWTIGPLFAEVFSKPGQHSELLLTAYSLPALLVGWIVGSLTKRFGKKMTAIVSLFMGSALLLMVIFVVSYFWLTLLLVFCASIFLSLSLPAINGVYADLIEERADREEEVEILTDFYTNLGYIFGPAAAGFIADNLGNAAAISAVGFAGICVAIVLFVITPRHITIPSK